MNAYSFDGLLVIALLLICSCAYLKRIPRVNSFLLSEKKGFFGVFYKAIRCNRHSSARLRVPRLSNYRLIHRVYPLIMVQHKMKQKVTLPKGAKQKVKKEKKQTLKKGQFLHIAPKKQHLINQEKVAAEVSRIINDKNEEAVKNKADTAVGRNKTD